MALALALHISWLLRATTHRCSSFPLPHLATNDASSTRLCMPYQLLAYKQIVLVNSPSFPNLSTPIAAHTTQCRSIESTPHNEQPLTVVKPCTRVYAVLHPRDISLLGAPVYQPIYCPKRSWIQDGKRTPRRRLPGRRRAGQTRNQGETPKESRASSLCRADWHKDQRSHVFPKRKPLWDSS
jgi:hypothetical protein